MSKSDLSHEVGLFSGNLTKLDNLSLVVSQVGQQRSDQALLKAAGLVTDQALLKVAGLVTDQALLKVAGLVSSLVNRAQWSLQMFCHTP